MAGKILLIRGGAIGDFLLTLPAIHLLRETFPAAHIEILGYPHIAALAKDHGHVNATRNIEYGPLAGFFNPKAELNPELCSYFSGFNQIISYLYDPDGFFEGNLKRCGVKNLIVGNARLKQDSHASIQLAEPLSQLGIFPVEPADILPLLTHDASFAEKDITWKNLPQSRLAIHPGSGSDGKNWPTERWATWIANFTSTHPHWRVIVTGGESDEKILRSLQDHIPDSGLQFIENKPLRHLAALFRDCQGFVGHDSGISHLAAATGCRCVLLFGPTNEKVWAPPGKWIKIVKSRTGRMSDIPLEEVTKAVDSFIVHQTP